MMHGHHHSIIMPSNASRVLLAGRHQKFIIPHNPSQDYDTQKPLPMPETSLKKLLIPALLTTGAVFTALSAPVAIFAGEKLRIEQSGETRFSGTVRDAAAPYLGLAGLTSAGLGLSGVALQGWRKTAKKAQKLDDHVTTLQQRLAERESHLQAALTSDYYLERSGLSFFLEDDAAMRLTPSVAAAAPEPMTVAAPAFEPALMPFAPQELATVTVAVPVTPIVAPAHLEPAHLEPAHLEVAPRDAVQATHATNYQVTTIAAMPITAAIPQSTTDSATNPNTTNPTTVSPLTTAQGFLSFHRAGQDLGQPMSRQNAINRHATTHNDDLTIAKIQALQTQLQQIVTQIESLQPRLPEPAVNLPAVNLPAVNGPEVNVQVVKDPSKLQSQSPSQLPVQPSSRPLTETAWVTRRAAS